MVKIIAKVIPGKYLTAVCKVFVNTKHHIKLIIVISKV